MRTNFLLSIIILILPVSVFSQGLSQLAVEELNQSRLQLKSFHDNEIHKHNLEDLRFEKKIMGTTKSNNNRLEIGDIAFTDNAAGLWKYESMTGNITQLLAKQDNWVLGDVEFDAQGTIYFLDKGEPFVRSGNIYIIAPNGELSRLVDTNDDILTFSPSGLHIDENGFLYVTALVSSEVGTSALVLRYDNTNQLWTLPYCKFNTVPDLLDRNGLFPQDIVTISDFFVFADLTPNGGAGVFFGLKSNSCPSIVGRFLVNDDFTAPLFGEPISLTLTNLVSPASALILIDNKLLDNLNNRSPGFVFFDPNNLSFLGTLSFTGFQVFSDIDRSIDPNSFIVADKGLNAIITISQNVSNLNFFPSNIIDLGALKPEGIAVFLGQNNNQKIVNNNELDKSFTLFQNHPNPFNPITNIEYQVRKNAHVSIKVYDILGREIKTLVSKNLGIGTYGVEWDGRDNSGNQVASGLYIYRMIADDFVASYKMLFLK